MDTDRVVAGPAARLHPETSRVEAGPDEQGVVPGTAVDEAGVLGETDDVEQVIPVPAVDDGPGGGDPDPVVAGAGEDVHGLGRHVDPVVADPAVGHDADDPGALDQVVPVAAVKLEGGVLRSRVVWPADVEFVVAAEAEDDVVMFIQGEDDVPPGVPWKVLLWRVTPGSVGGSSARRVMIPSSGPGPRPGGGGEGRG
jgi:hypothetical protein